VRPDPHARSNAIRRFIFGKVGKAEQNGSGGARCTQPHRLRAEAGYSRRPLTGPFCVARYPYDDFNAHVRDRPNQ